MTAHLTARNCLCVMFDGQVLAYVGLGANEPQRALQRATEALQGVYVEGDSPCAWAMRARLAKGAVAWLQDEKVLDTPGV